jgi:tRNA uridine 5-carboxymethylaminomethyl modification enzyme
MFPEYDIIVVGAGHAGCEAAAAAANLGSRALLITMNMQTIAQMSCNPAMGGIAKGQIIREIDSLGGYSGIVTDLSMIQFRMLNKSKGPAMWSPRAQNDRALFSLKWRTLLEKTSNLDFYQDMVKSLIIKNSRVCGVVTGLGHHIYSRAVILTNGTFLNGIIHIGENNFGGGRIAERPATGITEQLVSIGFESGRLKTGTPPRVDGRSLDYSKMDEQVGDKEIVGFSFIETLKPKNQKSCWATYTNTKTHEILKTGFDKSPLFTGKIDGVGPRYCPSIEDKINRFSERERHQLFVEPEGWNTIEVYINGFSTSLPEKTQYESLRSISGFESLKMFRPGYAIEYDFFPPTQLKYSLETKLISGLFFAGQINGTTGYEEAASQGIIAGINAHQKIRDFPPLILKRSEAYIGVLIDDLISKGTDEPYRMFTSRAEFRTLLRQDNADLRLTELSFRLGLASQERMDRVIEKRGAVEKIKSILKNLFITPEEINPLFEKIGSALLSEKQKAQKLLLRPDVELNFLISALPGLKIALKDFSVSAIEQASIQIKYEVYIEKERGLVQRMSQLEDLEIPEFFDYKKISSLGNEAMEKLTQIKPRTLGQASRISGINPSDVQILMVYMGR